MVMQRPARVPGRHRRIVTLTVHPDLYVLLHAAAQDRGITFGHVVELVLTRQLELPPLHSPA